MASGRRVDKANALIEAYGTVDELNAFTGHLIAHVSDAELNKDLTYIQHKLFNVGSILARDGADFPDYPTLAEDDISYLEKRIDHYDTLLSQMTAFILPAGSESITRAHLCRTICRRAERRVTEIAEQLESSLIIKYLNRLSDFYFIVARYLHKIEDIDEVTWQK